MNRQEFIESVAKIFKKADSASQKARKEGLLALEEDIDEVLAGERDIFEYGMRWVIDGTDKEVIDRILSNLIAQLTDPFETLLKTIQKETVLSIQSGDNPRIMVAFMASHISNSDLRELERLLPEVFEDD